MVKFIIAVALAALAVAGCVNAKALPHHNSDKLVGETPCERCVELITNVRNNLTSPVLAQRVETLLDVVCAFHPDQVAECKANISSVVGEVQANISRALANPQQICQKYHVCSQSMMAIGDDKECTMCQTAVQDLDKKLFGADGIIEQIKEKVEAAICDKVPSELKGMCEKGVEGILDALSADLRVKLADPKTVCQELKACPMALHHHVVAVKMPTDKICDDCVAEVNKIKDFATSAQTAEIARTLLDVVCTFKSDINQCKTDIANTIAEFQANVTRDLANPEQVCEKNHLCPGGAALSHPRIDVCATCVTKLTAIDNKLFAANGVVDNVKNALETTVCKALILPSLEDWCHGVVNITVDSAMANLKMELSDPKKACQDMNLCPKTVSARMASLPWEKEPEALPSCCGACVNVTGRILQFLSDPKLHQRLDTIVSIPCYFQVDKAQCESAKVAKVEAVLQNLTALVSGSCHQFGCCKPADLAKISSNPLECALCKLVGNVISSALQRGQTPDEIEQAATQVCNALPQSAIRQRCLAVVQKIDALTAAIQSNSNNVGAACQSINECVGNKKLAQKPTNVKDPITCLNCEILAGIIKQALLAGRTKDQILSDCLNFCSHLIPKPIADSCTNLVNTQLDQFIDIVKANNGDPKLSCVQFQKCPAAAAPAAKHVKKETGVLNCIVCQILGDLVNALEKQGKTKADIESQVLATCAKLPASLSAQCNASVTTILDPLIDALNASNNDVKAACQTINQCPANIGAVPLDCYACEIQASLLAFALKKGETKDEIDAKALAFCNELPEQIRHQCSAKIPTQIDPLIDALQTVNDDPLSACKAVSRCPASKAKKQARVHKKMLALAKKQQDPSPASCFVCKLLASILSQEIAQGKTKDQIEAPLLALCQKLPQNAQAQCVQDVTVQIGGLIDALAANNNDAEKACEAQGKCSPSSEILALAVQIKDPTPASCFLCKLLVSILSQQIAQGKTKDQIEAPLLALCQKLPQNAQAQCIQDVTVQIGGLIDALAANNNDAEKACEAQGKCSPSSQMLALAAQIQDPTPASCFLCKLLASILSQQIAQGKTKDQIEAPLLALCQKLPQNAQAQCIQDVTVQIGGLIDALAANNNDAEKACEAQGKCSPSADTTVEEQLMTLTMSTKTSDPTPAGCVVCKVMGSILSKLLVQNKTKAQIEDSLMAFCQKLPQQMQAQCESTVASQIGELLDALISNNNDVQGACVEVGACSPSSKQMEDPSSDMLEFAVQLQDPTPATCFVCKLLASILSQQIAQGKTKDQIEAPLFALCQKLPQNAQPQCIQAVTVQIGGLIDALAANNNDAEKACEAQGKCSPSSDSVSEMIEMAASIQDPNPAQCVVCRVLSTILSTQLLKGQTKDQIEAPLLALCQKLPQQAQAECIQIVTVQIGGLIDALTANGNNPQAACVAQGKCAPSTNEQIVALALQDPTPASCAICKILATILNAQLQQGKTKDQIEAPLLALCQKLPQNAQAQCIQAVTVQIGGLIDALVANGNDPEKACEAQQKCAPSSEMLIVLAGHIQDPTPVSCAVCKLTAAVIITQLNNGQSKDQILAPFLAVCQKLPQNLQPQCIQDVNTKIGGLIDALVASNKDAEKACEAQGQCSPSPSSAVQVQDTPTPASCFLCKLLASILSQQIAQGKTKDQIEAPLLALCQKLPQNAQPQCIQAVTVQIGGLIDALAANNNDAEKACEAQGKCSPSSVADVDADMCNMCVNIVGRVQSQAVMDEELSKAELEQICGSFKRFTQACDDFIEKEWNVARNDIEQFLDPKAVCSHLGLCH